MRKRYNLKKTSTSIVREIMNVSKDYQNLVMLLWQVKSVFKTTAGKRQKRKKTINTHNPFY